MKKRPQRERASFQHTEKDSREGDIFHYVFASIMTKEARTFVQYPWTFTLAKRDLSFLVVSSAWNEKPLGVTWNWIKTLATDSCGLFFVDDDYLILLRNLIIRSRNRLFDLLAMIRHYSKVTVNTRQEVESVKKMLDDIDKEVAYTRKYIGKDSLSPEVMEALKKVPREQFVSSELKRLAYSNGPLPIGCGQTISQPYIVALMTDLLRPQRDFKVLEVGTGSGYQSAVLSCLVKKVYSTEIIAQLAGDAQLRLQRLGYDNVEIKVGDGYFGWEEFAPYDGIIVTAAASEMPPPLIEQLKPGSRLVIPVGRPHMYQELMMIEKDEKGQVHSTEILGVAFVPLTGERTRERKD